MTRSDTLPDICRDTIRDHNMITRGDSLVVGVSGGADSVALLCCLHSLAAELGFTLSAAHLNHNLRGAESDRDEAHVRALCRRLDIPLAVDSRSVAALAKERGETVEECARAERYRLFGRLAGESGKAATAHTLDDSAETLLLNLARGTGPRGLCGIPPVRGNIIRPLIRCTRSQVEAYCAQNGLAFVNDSSNDSDSHTRNRLRHHVLPVLRDINPAFLRRVQGTTDALRADCDLLDAMAAQALEDARTGRHTWDAPAVRARPEPVRRRMLLSLCAAHGVPLEQDRILRLEAILFRGGQEQVSGEWYCRCGGDTLSFLPVRSQKQPPVARSLPVDLSRPGEYHVYSDKILRICPVKTDIYEKNKNNRQNQFKNALDCDKIGGIVECRPRLPGDSYRPAGRGCTKTLRKLCQESGLSAHQRARLLVLADEQGPLWAESFGVAQRAAPDADSRRVLTVEVVESVLEEERP